MSERNADHGLKRELKHEETVNTTHNKNYLELIASKMYNEYDFLLGVSIKVTGDCRNVFTCCGYLCIDFISRMFWWQDRSSKEVTTSWQVSMQQICNDAQWKLSSELNLTKCIYCCCYYCRYLNSLPPRWLSYVICLEYAILECV